MAMRVGWSKQLLGVAGMAMLFTGGAGAATPQDTLVMAWNIDAISTFDPAQIGEVVTNELITNTCDTLVDYQQEDPSKVRPALAESWEVSEDGQEITFLIRDGLSFPSGNKLTAGDIAWSMQRVVKLGFGNAATMTEYGFTEETVDEQITAPDDRTLVVKLDKPYPMSLFLQAIGANRVSIGLDRELLLKEENDGDFGNKYLTTNTACVGPYRLRQWNAGEVVVLEANEGYWRAQPAMKRIIVRHVAEASTQRLLLEQGDVDVARDLTPEDMKALEQNPDVEIVRTLRPQLVYWAFNNADPAFANDKVRLAMRYLIDYDGLARTVMAYDGEPRASFVQMGAFGALGKEEGQPFKLDTEKAKELLAEGGYPDGFDTTMIIATLPYTAPLAQHVQANAAKVGVNIKIEQMASAQLFSKVRGRDFDTAILGWQTSVADAHGMASRQIYNPDNSEEAKLTMYPSWRGSFRSEEANRMIEEALLERDTARRENIYKDLQRQMLEKGPVAYMFQMYNTAGIRKDVKDWTWNGFRTYYDVIEKG